MTEEKRGWPSSDQRDEYLPNQTEKSGGLKPAPDVRITRQLPHSVEAEHGVLSSMLIGGPDALDLALEKIDQDAFYVPAHRTLYNTMCCLHLTKNAVDLITYTQQLRDEGLLDEVGGAAFVTKLYSFVPTAANLMYYIDLVREKWLARRMISTCTQAITHSYEGRDWQEVNEILDKLQSDVIELSNLRNTNDPMRHIGEFVAEALEQIQTAYEKRGQPTGIRTGFNDLDRMTNGLEPGQVYVFGGRPAMGKTSFLLSVASFISVQCAIQGIKTKIFSLEMTGVQLARRMLLSAANLTMQRMRDGFIKKSGLEDVQEAAKELINSNIFIDDKAGLNIFEFRARSRRAVLKKGVNVIMIDYLQMMKGVSRRAKENRQAEISEIIQAIAETAKELQVPIIVLAQLGRKAEERKWGIPEMSDLRESGDIENYAHVIALLWRAWYYVRENPTKAEALAEMLQIDEEELKFYAQAIVVKQREGPVGPVPLKFLSDFARYENVTEKMFSNNPAMRQHNYRPGDGSEELP